MDEKLIFQQSMYESLHEFYSRRAISYAGKEYSYEEVDKRSEQILDMLRGKGLKKSDQVILFMEDRADLLISIIACLKGAYIFIPFDTDYSVQRLANMYNAIDGKLILSDKANYSRIKDIIGRTPEYNQLLLLEDIIWKNDELKKSEYNEALYTPDDPIYIFYTSGSTGKPKAIIGRNKSLLHFINWEIETFPGWKNAVVSQLTTPCHDPILRDLFVALFSGGTVAIPRNKEVILNMDKLVKWIDTMKVTHIHCTPSLFKAMVENKLSEDTFKELRYILMAGEKLNRKALKEWYGIFQDRVTLVNMYGSTETTMIKTYYIIGMKDIEKESIPIGKPMKGAKTIILDEHKKVCPKGIIGEIYIRTPYRSLGYYNQSLNEECFIVNPFSDSSTDILYKTGDLGKILEDGNIQFHGRIDRQVKIRGIRVELGEVEKYISLFDGVKEACVVMKQVQNADKIMVAFYTAEGKIDQEELKKFLNERMSDNIIPVSYIHLVEIPLLSNGKTNYKALEEYRIELVNDIKKPRNAIEEKMADIWKDILGIEEVGINQNFLHIGGHSLNIMTMIAKISREFNVELSLSDIFANATIEHLAHIIAESGQVVVGEKIVPMNHIKIFPLSDTQKRMYAIWRTNVDSTVYNMPAAYWVKGDIDKEKLEKAIGKVIREHKAFQVRFIQVNDKVQQELVDNISFALETADIEENDVEAFIHRFIRPFNLESTPLIRGALVRAGEQYLFIIDIHHIIGDALSMEIMIKQIVDEYSGIEMSKVNYQYTDYCNWNTRYHESNAYKKQEEFWLDLFKDTPPILNIKTDYERSHGNDNKGKLLYFDMKLELMDKVYDYAAKNYITPNLLFFAVYVLLLYRYSGQNDITVGTIVAGRTRHEESDIIGPFINTLALRNKFNKKISFHSFLQLIKNNTIEAYENQEYAFNQLVECLKIPHEAGRNPLFDYVYDFQNENKQQFKLKELEFTPIKLKTDNARFDFCLHITELNRVFSCGIEYKTGLFHENTIRRFMERFENLLINAISQQECEIGNLEFYGDKEKENILKMVGNIEQKIGFGTVDSMFHNCVLENEDSVALEFWNEENIKQTLTYGELNERANDVATYLSKNSIQPGNVVGVYMNKIHNAIITMLGVLKTGAAFLPIGVGYYSPNLVETMVKNSEMKMLISEESNDKDINTVIEKLENRAGTALKVIRYEAIPQQTDRNTLGRTLYGEHDEESLAYIIYTSGTTGVPKGVMLKHKGLVNIAQAMKHEMEITREKRVLQFSSLSFDMSVWEIYTTLLNGATLCILNRTDSRRNEVEKFLKDETIQVATLTPSLLKVMDSEELPSLKVIVCAGESCSKELIDKWNLNRKFINAYGPTETTICATLHIVRDKNARNIGKPIRNTTCYVLDENRNICPIGITGELYVGGIGLAAGYLNNEALTKDKFVDCSNINGERLYRTGDLVMWNGKGDLEILGRCDEQIKIRGFRIELGQIEAKICSYQGITDGAVVKTDADELYAFYVSDNQIEKQELLKYLKVELPSYMVPAYLKDIDKMPVTASGKVDKQKLINICANMEAETTNKVMPRNDKEKLLLQVWEDVLKRENIGIEDNFFEIGGHSLNVIQIISKAKEAGLQIKVADIYTGYSIKNMFDLGLI